MFYWFAHGIWLVVSFFFFPLTVRGRENLPRRVSCILASNHASNLDPMIIGIGSGRRLSYMAKHSLFANPFFRIVLGAVGAFPVKRETADIGALREAAKRLKHGCPLVVFPQGTRKEFKTDDPAHAGIGFLAAKCQVPVIPVYIRGSDQVMPPKSRFFKRHPVLVTFGPPLTFAKNESYDTIASRIMAGIGAVAQNSA